MIDEVASHTFVVGSTLSQTEAFVRLVDLSRVPEWDEGVASSTPMDDDVPRRGSRYDVTVAGFDGEPTSVVYELTELDEPNRFVMVGANDEFRAEDTLMLDGDGSGCTLTYVGSLSLLGENPPLTPAQLDSMFPKIAAVAEAGLTAFLNP